MRFDRRVRYFTSVLHVFFALLWMPVAIYVPALTFNMVTGIDMDIIAPITCVICTIYTCVGGIKGVMWTDVLQGFIMLATLLFITVKGTLDVGGLGVVYQRNLDSGRLVAPDWTMDPTVRMGFFAIFVGGTILKLQSLCISQAAIQRFSSLPNLKAVKHALIILILGLVLLLGLCTYIGLVAYAKYYNCDPMTTGLARAKDQIVPLLVMQIASNYPGIPGLFVSGVLSAALSSLSTVLNSLSAVVLKDFIEPHRRTPLTEHQTAFVLRGIVLAFGMFSLVTVHAAKHLGLVMQFSATLSSISSGPFLGIFTVGFMLPFVNSKSVLTGSIVATLFSLYIATRAQIDIITGRYSATPKPISIDGCEYDFPMPKNWNTTIESSGTTLNSKSFHHISFLCYGLFGTVITVIVSLLATLYFGRQDTSEMDPNLVAPLSRRFLKRNVFKNVNDRLHIDKQDLKEAGYTVVNQIENEQRSH